MKTQSALLRSIGALFLPLLVLVALPCSTARASQGQCGDVEISPIFGPGSQISLLLEVEPPSCVIYVTTSNNPSFPNPSRSGSTPISPTFTVPSGTTASVLYGTTLYVKAFAYKPLWTQSVNLSEADQHNPNW